MSLTIDKKFHEKTITWAYFVIVKWSVHGPVLFKRRQITLGCLWPFFLKHSS